MTPAVQGLSLEGYGEGTPQIILGHKLGGQENTFEPSV